jgi:hypothetical protein
MGVAVGDYDNDGYPDVFVTAYGRCVLYHNNRNGTFSDVTSQAGVATPGWTTSAVWFDYDGDGRLDLFVGSFVQYTKESQKLCLQDSGGVSRYCVPRMFRPTASFLYKNNGEGTFRDVGRETGLAAKLGKTRGAVATDIDNDGRMDLFVANDTVENFLFANRRQGWEEIALGAQVGVSSDGWPRSGMGVDSADIDGERSWLEHEFQSDLNLPRVEPGAREHAEGGRSQLVARLTEDRTIGQVEDFDARLDVLRTDHEPLVG